jgi:hypothetical protein
LYSLIYFHLVKDELWIKKNKASFQKGCFIKLRCKGFVGKLLEEGKEVSFQDLSCTKKYLFIDALFEVMLKGLKDANIKRLHKVSSVSWKKKWLDLIKPTIVNKILSNV